MADIDISQAEADTLIAMEKHCVESKIWLFPEPGSRLSIALSSPDKRESFYSQPYTGTDLPARLRRQVGGTGASRPIPQRSGSVFNL